MDSPAIPVKNPDNIVSSEDKTKKYLMIGCILLALGIILFSCKDKLFSYNKKTNKKKVKFDLFDSPEVTVQELEIIFYGTMACPYCQKAKDMFVETNDWDKIEFIDTSTPEGSEAFVNAGGGSGVPFFVSKKTGQHFTGFPGSLEHLKNVLKTEPFKPNTKNDFEWFGNMRCPWCQKTKELFDSTSLKIQFHDTGTHEGKLNAQKARLSGGIPFIINVKTGKNFRGYPESIAALTEKTT